MQYWLLKSEPETYSWEDLCQRKRDMWEGVRNYAARNHLKAMRIDDRALFYHSGKERAVVGVVRVVAEHYPDPTAALPHTWVVVDIVPERQLERPVSLQELRKEAVLADMVLLRMPRLSVQPVQAQAFAHIVSLARAPSSSASSASSGSSASSAS